MIDYNKQECPELGLEVRYLMDRAVAGSGARLCKEILQVEELANVQAGIYRQAYADRRRAV